MAAGQRLGGLAQPLQEGARVDVRLAEEGLDLALDVVPQPRDGGELGAVGLLMEAHPQPEVVRFHLQLALHVHDVRRDEQQPPALSRGRQVPGGRCERLVLAQDTGGQERQQHAQLHAGDLAAHRAEHRAAGGRRAAVLHLGQQRLEHGPEPGDVRLDPAGPVHDEDRRVMRRLARRVGLCHPREGADMGLGGLGVLAQLGDDRARLVPAHLRPRPHEPGRGRDREIPVDHLGPTDARHEFTVRGRSAVG